MGMSLKLYTPPSPALVVDEVPRWVSLAVTVVPGRAAPEESSTVPVMLAVVCWLNKGWLALQSPRTITRATPHKVNLFILASKTTGHYRYNVSNSSRVCFLIDPYEGQ